MTDVLEYFENSLIQHGKENNRVYLMKFGSDCAEKLVDHIETLADKHNYTKIFTKIPATRANLFLKRGYIQEASIPKFFKGSEECLFLVKYLDESRKQADRQEIEVVISGSLAKKVGKKEPLNDEFALEELNSSNAAEIAGLYRKVFPSYPFPIFEHGYILKTMLDNVIYFGAKKDGKIIALSSAEIDYDNLNVEMTDFATNFEFRGRNLSLYLLQKMQEKMKELDIKTVYTIARSLSFGMNTTFARDNYEFGGMLINNTNISGKIESMNVWYKSI